MMKKIYILFASIAIILLLSSCSEGGFSDGSVMVDENGNYYLRDTSSSSSGSSSSGGSGGSTTISITIDACPINTPALNGTTNGSTTETIEVGDTVIKDSATAVITLVTNSNGTKNICVVSGTAHISR